MNPKRRRIHSSLVSSFTLCLCLFGMVALQRVIAEEGLSESKSYYIVRQGDTLWDITEHFYHDPYLWPAVWGQNPHIANPHWIYPGDPIYLASIAGRYLSDVGYGAGPAAPATAEVPPVQPKAFEIPTASTMYISRRIADTSLLSMEATGNAGRILAGRNDNILLSEGDEVFLQLPEPVDASYQGPYQVLRGIREIHHPQTGKTMGTLYAILGYARVVGPPENGVARGTILLSQDAIEAGDLIRKGAPPQKEVHSNLTKSEINGCIVAGLRTDELLAEYDVVFIDQGIEQGVQTGDTFWVLNPPRQVRNPSGVGTLTLPDTRQAALVVISAERETSTALVTDSLGSISAGDRVRSRME